MKALKRRGILYCLFSILVETIPPAMVCSCYDIYIPFSYSLSYCIVRACFHHIFCASTQHFVVETPASNVHLDLLLIFILNVRTLVSFLLCF